MSETIYIPTERRSAYLFVRHMAPDVIRNIRAAYDVGSTESEIIKVVNKKTFADMVGKPAVIAAIGYMALNPDAGVVVWDGQRYTWKSD